MISPKYRASVSNRSKILVFVHAPKGFDFQVFVPLLVKRNHINHIDAAEAPHENSMSCQFPNLLYQINYVYVCTYVRVRTRVRTRVLAPPKHFFTVFVQLRLRSVNKRNISVPCPRCKAVHRQHLAASMLRRRNSKTQFFSPVRPTVHTNP